MLTITYFHGSERIHSYNTVIKHFSNGVVHYKRTSFDKFKGLQFSCKHNGTNSVEENEEKTRQYLKKVKTNIIDLAFNYNSWQYFITLTFDFRGIGEYSHDKAIDLLKKWINNQKHQNPGMTYLLVPEFHKSGRLHFHGLISNVPKWKFEEARYPNGKLIKINGVQIYNLVNYKIGFTTISNIQSQEKVSTYISKYATKDLITLKNKKRYWYSRNLEKPKTDYVYYFNTLKDVFKDNSLNYYNSFDKSNCSIEVASLSED